MILFRAYIEWENFYASQLVEYEVKYDHYEGLHDYLVGSVMASDDVAKLKTATEKKKIVSQNPQVKAAHDELTAARKGKRLFTVLRDNSNRQAAFISRELTRRTGRDSYEARQQRSLA